MAIPEETRKAIEELEIKKVGDALTLLADNEYAVKLLRELSTADSRGLEYADLQLSVCGGDNLEDNLEVGQLLSDLETLGVVREFRAGGPARYVLTDRGADIFHLYHTLEKEGLSCALTSQENK